MDPKQAARMLAYHERMARLMRAEAEKPANQKHRDKLLKDAKAADRMALRIALTTEG